MTHEKAHDFKSIGGHMARGALWMVAMRWAMKLVGLVNTVIIARLLDPADFGLVAMATIVVGFVEMLTEFGVDMVLLRNPAAGRSHYDSAWTAQVVTGLVATSVMCLAAPLAAAYFGDDRVTIVIRIASLRAGMLGFTNIGIVDFRRNLDFAKEFRFWVYRRLSLFGLGLVLVVVLRSYLALAISIPVSAVVAVAFSYTMSPYRPRLSFAHLRDIWSFSQWQMVFNAAQFLNRRADEVVVAGIAGATGMGEYFVASDLSTLPTREVVQPVGRTMVPTMAALAHDPAELWIAYMHMLEMMMLVCCALGVGLALVSDDFVALVLGQRWLDTIPYFTWLAVGGAAEALLLGLQSYFVVLGGERAYGLGHLAGVVLLVSGSVAVGKIWGLPAIPLARLAAMLVLAGGLLGWSARLGRRPLAAMARSLWRAPSAALAMAGAVTMTHAAVLPWHSHLLSLSWDVAIGAPTYIAADLLLWVLAGRPAGAERALLKAVRAGLARLR